MNFKQQGSLRRDLHNKVKGLSVSPFTLDLISTHCTNNNIRITKLYEDHIGSNPYSYMFFISKSYTNYEDEFISIVAKEILLAIPSRLADIQAGTFVLSLYLDYENPVISIRFDHLGD